jgi:hypothetical protein
MTRAQAQTAADLVLAGVGVAAAIVVITTPPLRRLAGRALRVWLGATVPAYLVAETRRAWVESGRRGLT